MADHKEMDDFLLQDCGGKFQDKTWLLGLLGSWVYTPTGEKVVGGFRYFACEVGPVLAAFEANDLAALSELPYALDEDGDGDTSSVLISFKYTQSGSVVAMQVEEYHDYRPVPMTPVRLLEGAEGQAVIAKVKEIDQTR